MIEHRSVRMDLMSSKEVAEYLKSNDMVILPVGCFEMHGPLVPLACDTFTSWAASILLSEKWNCLSAPPIVYAYPGASGPWPGTVDISPTVTMEYIKAVVCGLLKGGFRRVVLCGLHMPINPIFQMVIRTIYQESGQIVMALRPGVMMPKDLTEQQLGYGPGEDIAVLAAMKILGLHGAYDPSVCEVDKPSGMSLDNIEKLGDLGASVPWVFTADYQHTGVRSCLRMEDADKAVALMKDSVDSLGDIPELFAEYQQQMRELDKTKPWSDPAWSV